MILSQAQNRQLLLEQERRGREDAAVVAGKLAHALNDCVHKSDAHTVRAESAVRQLREPLRFAHVELQRVQHENQQKLEHVAQDAESRRKAVLQTEQVRIAQLVQENQRHTASTAELEQERTPCQSEGVAFRRAYEVFEQHGAAGDKQIAQEFEARAMDAQKDMGKREVNATIRAAQEQKMSQELAACEARAKQVEAAEAAKLAEWARDVVSEKSSLLAIRRRAREAEDRLVDSADRLTTLANMSRDSREAHSRVYTETETQTQELEEERRKPMQSLQKLKMKSTVGRAACRSGRYCVPPFSPTMHLRQLQDRQRPLGIFPKSQCRRCPKTWEAAVLLTRRTPIRSKRRTRREFRIFRPRLRCHNGEVHC